MVRSYKNAISTLFGKAHSATLNTIPEVNDLSRGLFISWGNGNSSLRVMKEQVSAIHTLRGHEVLRVEETIGGTGYLNVQ